VIGAAGSADTEAQTVYVDFVVVVVNVDVNVAVIVVC
jgi:hypothetical protein